MAAVRRVLSFILLMFIVPCFVNVACDQGGLIPEAIKPQADVVREFQRVTAAQGGGRVAGVAAGADDGAAPRYLSNKLNPGMQESLNRQPSVVQQNPKQLSADTVPAAGRRPQPIKIADSPACAADVKALCSSSSVTNNFGVLDCLQSDDKSKDVTKACQNFIWSYKRSLTNDIRFDSAAAEVCKETMEEFPDCKMIQRGIGHMIPCLIDHKENVTNPNCKQFLTKMASIVFSDYRLIYKFTETCTTEITQFECGRLHVEGDDAPHSQGKTVECLSQHVQNLGDNCKHEILRIAELQADDYHMDRPLFYACRDDRERFCHRTKSGSGKVFKCLYRHKFEKDMSSECRKKLVLRQKLMQDDYKVNKGLAESCRADIRTYHCTIRGDSSPHTRTGRMAVILLCLEGAMKDGNAVSPECVGELREMRRSLLEDYNISPDLVKACHVEIADDCGGGLLREGKTLHCLMDLARPKRRDRNSLILEKKISDGCRVALEDLLEEADIGENYQMDQALAEACQPVVDLGCKDINPGDARVIACLMEKIGTDHMTDECEERLLEIQYFVSRDFKLDSQLYKNCHKDANKHCHSPEEWFNPDSNVPEQAHLIFSCLYRHFKLYATDSELQLSRSCSFEVKRAMHQRAVNIDLEPRIEEPCLPDLGRFCSENTEKGEEIECLQDNFSNLMKDCQYAVGNFTQDEADMPQLDRILMKSCTPMLKRFCEDLLNNDETEPGDVMECLIQYKNHADMNRKCASGIEHHQMMSLKDYTFSYKFKEACKGDVLKLCPSVRKKSEVIKCLSEQVRNDTLLDLEHRVTHGCRKQLRFELLQRSENIKLDPDLQQSCSEDVNNFCSRVTPGRSQIIECLKSHQADLTFNCRNIIFKREAMEAVDNRVDYKFMMTCKRMIKHFCQDEHPSDILTCLQKHRDDDDFDDEDCRKVIATRQIIRAKDYRLNPALAKSCKLDIPKFCKPELKQYAESDKHEGKIIHCLKLQFPKHRLSGDCEAHIRELMKESAVDYRQDPVLAAACKHEITEYCQSSLIAVNDGNAALRPGGVEECLKNALAGGRISKDSQCLKEVVRLLAENRADVHVDPLLHRACSLDLKHYCFDIPSGEGRLMSCLLSALDDKTVRLQTECRKMLQDRVTMWEYAAKVAPPDSFGELYLQIAQSKAKNFFLGSIFSILAFIFIGGLCCGRVTKRIRPEAKNK